MDWASLAGSAIGAGVSYFGQAQANRENIDLAREQMAFQERMADTAHQREVEDLRKAGLNPILSAGGSGAAVPTGALPVVQSTAGQAGKMIGDAVSQATQNAATKVGIDNTQKDTVKKMSEVNVNAAQQKMIEAQTTNVKNQGKLYQVLGDALDSMSPALRMSTKGWQFIMNGAKALQGGPGNGGNWMLGTPGRN